MSNVVIIGAGNVGGALATVSERAGHAVTALTRSSEDAAAIAAFGDADIVVLATPFDAALELPEAWRGALAGHIVIDATNPLTADFSALTVGFNTSGSEQIAERLPGALVVKALNAVLAPNHDPSGFGGTAPFVPLAGDDESAVEAVRTFLATLGFEALATGPLLNARYIEPLAEILIQLAYFRGAGTGIALALMRS